MQVSFFHLRIQLKINKVRQGYAVMDTRTNREVVPGKPTTPRLEVPSLASGKAIQPADRIRLARL